jgi:hypothetical protein
VADYTFLGLDQYAFSNGWKLNVSDVAGSLYTSSTTLNAEVLIFTS